MTQLLKEFFITKDFTIFIAFVVVYLLYLLKNKFFKKFVTWIIKRTPTKLDDDLYPLFSQLINIILFGSAIITTLIKLGVDINAILTACGAGSLAIALAVKDSIANILAGFIIMIDRPFLINDKINLNGEDLIVLEIGLRRTIFESRKEKVSILIICNLDLIKTKIYNYSMVKRVEENE